MEKLCRCSQTLRLPSTTCEISCVCQQNLGEIMAGVDVCQPYLHEIMAGVDVCQPYLHEIMAGVDV